MSNRFIFVRLGKPGMSRAGSIPCAFVVEKSIRSLLVLFSYRFWFFVSLKPRLVLFMESPALVLQRFCSHVLLICVLAVIEDVEESICVDLAIEGRVIDGHERLLGVIAWRVVLGLRPIVFRSLSVQILRAGRV